MHKRSVVWSTSALFLLASCIPNNDTQHNGAPTADTVTENGELTNIFPSSFEGSKKLDRDSNGTVSLLQGDNLSLALEGYAEYRRLFESKSFGEMAVEFVHFFKKPFQLEHPRSELSVTRVQEDDLGFHQVRLAQNYETVPVMYAELIVHFDRDDHVYLVQGQYIPTPANLNLVPKMTLDEVMEGIHDHGSVSADSTSSGPFILPSNDSSPKLVYQLISRVSLTDQSMLLVDANNGRVLRKVPTIYSGT